MEFRERNGSNETRIIMGGVSALGALVGLVVARQVFASSVGYDESLGANVWGIYWPGVFSLWWHRWSDTAANSSAVKLIFRFFVRRLPTPF